MSSLDSTSTAARARSGVLPWHRVRRRGLSLWTACGMAIESLVGNKARATLAALGIIIGVGCVITMMALGKGTAIQMQEQIRSFGTNVLTIRPAQRRQGAVRLGRDSGNFLRLEDVDAILERCPAITAVSPRVDDDMRVKYGRMNNRTEVLGVTNDVFRIRNFKFAEGRPFLEDEMRTKARVCLLGAEIADDFFEGRSPIGEKIQVKGQPFRVIGVMASHGGTDAEWNDRVWVPVTTAMARIFQREYIERIDAQAVDEASMPLAQEQIERALRRAHGLKSDDRLDFEVTSQADALETAEETSATLTAFLAGIASMSLLVGGIGIMNIMLISVIERTREIGIRRAVGARQRDIMIQFLIESLLMCGAGAVLGILAGFGACYLGAAFAAWPIAITTESIAVSCTCAVSIGLFFGLYPAVRASKLSPLTALRHD